MISYN